MIQTILNEILNHKSVFFLLFLFFLPFLFFLFFLFSLASLYSLSKRSSSNICLRISSSSSDEDLPIPA